MSNAPKPVLLCILDGWGHREEAADNAIRLAATPVYDHLWQTSPHALLATSGAAVGLPDGQMGNSEVGHMNLGAGRIVLQDLPKIDRAFSEGGPEDNPAFEDMIAKLEQSGGTCHLMGLLSPGGVHSHQAHMAQLAKAVAENGVLVQIHMFLDGRDTPPKSALQYIAAFEKAVRGAGDIRMATVSGRYYAMDRDQRWDRVEKAYRALVSGEGQTAATAKEAVEHAYARDESDEFVLPTVIDAYDGMKDGDGVLMANFRADRAREILTALADPDFDGFPRKAVIDFAARTGMTDYSSVLNQWFTSLFPPEAVEASLGEVISKAGLKQLRIAETEKYAHVTFFFNGGEEKVSDGEDRELIPSPKVATYDLKPEMSAYEVTDKLVAAIGSGKYDLIVANYANPDMVGHTGIMAAAIKAVECIDACLGRLKSAIGAAGGVMLITADHGNVELMRDHQTQQAHTAHTTLEVPILLVNSDIPLSNGRLADVAPTVLALMGLEKPPQMTGRSLLDYAGAEKGVRHASL